MVGVILAMVGTGLVGAMGMVVFIRYRRRRRLIAQDEQRVFLEVRLAMADPLLIHQARRRVRETHASEP
jgi:hypothetical protein